MFSRKAWAVLIQSPSEAFAGYQQVLREAGKFTKLLGDTRHTIAAGRNDMATLDRFIGVIRRALAEHTAETGEHDWASRLPEAVHGFNENGAPALYGSAPDDLRRPNGQVRNQVLAFERQWDESHFMVHNAELIKQHADKLNDEGSFRTYIRKERLGRRIFDAHWSRETHTVGTIRGGFVRDLDGNEFPTKEVLPVPSDSNVLPEAPHRINARARGMLQRYADRLKAFLTAKEDHRIAASKAHAVLSEEGDIKQAVQLAGLTTSKVIASFVGAFPDVHKMETPKKGGAAWVHWREQPNSLARSQTSDTP